MGIQDILMDSSVWTWEIMERSSQLGEMIREDAITSVNLANINHRAQREGIGLSITSFQGAKLESEFGADWMWSLESSSWLVQAKRLDVVGKLNLLSYTINLSQLNLLVDASQTLSNQFGIDAKPAYVFYNSMILNGNPAEMGCMFINAMLIQSALSSKLGQASATLSLKAALGLGATPWYRMFG
jgi:hypothetical protein